MPWQRLCRTVHEQIWFNTVRQNRCQGIEECSISQIGAIEAVLHRSTPDHLMRAIGHGKYRQGAFRSEQLVRPLGFNTPQNNLCRQAALPVTVLKHVDAQRLPGGRQRTIRGDDECR